MLIGIPQISRSPLLTALTLRAEGDFTAAVLTLLSSNITPPLAENLEELGLFNVRISHYVYPLEAIRQFVARHLRFPESYRALDTLIVSEEEDRAWLEPYVGNLQLESNPATAFYTNSYYLPDFSGYQPIDSDEEDDEDDEDNEEGVLEAYPYDYDDGFSDDPSDEDNVHMDPDDLDWMLHMF